VSDEPIQKTITLEDLLVVVQRGFQDVDRQFHRIEMQMERLDAILLGKQQQRVEELETAIKKLRNIALSSSQNNPNDQQPTQQEKNNP
jgi:hypothetical protein